MQDAVPDDGMTGQSSGLSPGLSLPYGVNVSVGATTTSRSSGSLLVASVGTTSSSVATSSSNVAIRSAGQPKPRAIAATSTSANPGHGQGPSRPLAFSARRSMTT